MARAIQFFQHKHLIAICLLALVCGGILTGCETKQSDQNTQSDSTPTISSLRLELQDNRDDPDLRLRLARLYLQEGDGASAESHFRRALKLETNDADAPLDLVFSLLLQRKNDEALELIDSRLSRLGDKASARLWLLRGEAQLGENKVDKIAAQQSFHEAIVRSRQEANQRVIDRIEQLSLTNDLVLATKEHVECAKNIVQMYTPEQSQASSDNRRVLKVGPTRKLKAPSHAARIVEDGDLVEIDAGVYRGDVAIWQKNNLILRGVGGIAKLEAAGKIANHLGIWVFEGDNITAENIGFSGARSKHKNGAGIRLHGRGSTIRNCQFRNNENGILGSHIEDNDVLVEFSTFIENGYGDGQSHNIYIGQARSFTLRYSYSQGAKIGHLVKSRAYKNAILFNRIIDGENGNSSYVINLPEGGQAWIVGNELQQGNNADNRIMISFGEEHSQRKDQSLHIINNTIYNRVLDATYVRNSTDAEAVMKNNILAGAPSIPFDGPGIADNNLRQPGPWFVDAHGFDFNLTPEAPAIDTAIDPNRIIGLTYLPDAEYVHPARGRARKKVGPYDMGAREYCAAPSN